jgi:hypothetical protein
MLRHLENHKFYVTLVDTRLSDPALHSPPQHISIKSLEPWVYLSISIVALSCPAFLIKRRFIAHRWTRSADHMQTGVSVIEQIAHAKRMGTGWVLIKLDLRYSVIAVATWRRYRSRSANHDSLATRNIPLLDSCERLQAPSSTAEVRCLITYCSTERPGSAKSDSVDTENALFGLL